MINNNNNNNIMNAGSPFGIGPHADVLKAAVPDTAEGRQKLVEELKNRARSTIQGQQYPTAMALYNKALEVATDIPSERAILHSNLSLVQGKMNLWEDARESAKMAVEDDDTYVKGWWRLGQAAGKCNDSTAAAAALERGLALEPTNKALAKELERMKLQKDKPTPKAAAPKTEPASKITSKSTTAKPKTTKTTTSSSSTSVTESDSGAFTKSDHVKGYKIVNGKKTSYFHNELDETTKALIGDIAPKKLEQQPAASASAASDAAAAAAPGSTSAWNTAGTWEEKDVTGWAIEELQTELTNMPEYNVPIPTKGCTMSITSAKVKGHASVAAVRGKKKYIYELSVSLDWKFRDGGKNLEATGSMEFPDVDGTITCPEEYEAINFSIQQTDDDALRSVLRQGVVQSGFQLAVGKTIDGWVQLFRKTYGA